MNHLEVASSRSGLFNGGGGGTSTSVASGRKEYEWDPKVYANHHQNTVIN